MGFSVTYFIDDLLTMLENMGDDKLKVIINYVKEQQKYAKDCGVL